MKITESEQSLYGKEPTVINKTDEFSWGLTRKDGHWQPQIAKKWSFHNWSTSSKSFVLYDLPLEAPKKLIPHNELSYSFSDIKKRVPNAVDAVSSPSKDLLVVLTPTSIIVYMGNDFSNSTSFSLKGKESLIMAEWALGNYVEKWTFELSKHLK